MTETTNTTRNPYDIVNEGLLIGCLFKNPDLYIESGSLIKSKYDFYDENTRFLFDSFETIYKSTSDDITEDKVNMFMIKEDTRKAKYKKLGGWKFINNLTDLCNIDDFNVYFDLLKKFSLIRELGRIGFPVNRLLSHPKFDDMKAEQVTMTMRTSLEKIHTLIGGGNDSVILGKDMTSSVLKWSEVPDMGIELPFKMWTDLFKGWRKKKLIVDGMLSNEGKSRKLVYVATFISLILGKKVLIMANEMDEDDLKACMITTVCNNPEFGFSYSISERKITLGEYENEAEMQKVLEVAKYIEENTQIFFKDMENYSDEAIEHEMRKHVVGRGVEYIFYDTLKGHKADGWELVKQTTTKIRDLIKALNVGGYATIQLTDDSSYIDIFDFSSNNIANAKQLKHVVDYLILEKKIQKSEYSNYRYIDDWGQEMELDNQKTYHMEKLDKNRSGAKGMVLVQEVDLDLNIWKEIGLGVRVQRGGR